MRVFYCVITLLFLSVRLFAQPPHDSPVFDPECYFPEIDKQGEIDTIYGSHSEQRLGADLGKIPPAKGESYDRIVFSGLPSHAPFIGAYKTGQSFDLKALELSAKMNLDISGGTFGHFRDTWHVDCFDNYLQRIYWVDEEGNYHKDRFTQLRSQKSSKVGIYSVPAQMGTIFKSIVGHFTNDSLYDILVGAEAHRDDPLRDRDSCFLELFTGKDYSSQDTLRSDSILFLYKTFDTTITNSRTICEGDFRGTGRKDIVAGDDKGNLFFYKNSPPFTMQRFADAIRYDTLYSTWENRPYGGIINGATKNESAKPFAALPRPEWDKSVDYIIQLTNSKHVGFENEELSFFRGGPTFGEKRLLIPDAQEVFVALQKIDPVNFWGMGVMDYLIEAGDMNGSGLPSGYYGGLYLLGKAFDQKNDMDYYFYSRGTGAKYQTKLRLDADTLDDMVISFPGHLSDDDNFSDSVDIGSIHVIHGSKKIPVRLNPKYAVRKADFYMKALTVISQASNICEIEVNSLKSEEAVLTLYNLLGQKIDDWQIRLEGKREQFLINIPNLPSGVYILALESKSIHESTRVSIIH